MTSVVSSTKKHRSVPLASLLLLAAMGCGGSRSTLEIVEVNGVVTLDGQPLESAEVIFRPAEGRSSIGRTDAAGQFALEYMPGEFGAVSGKHTVSVSTFVEGDADSDDPEKKAAHPERVPLEYNEKTTLTAEVSASSSEPITLALVTANKTMKPVRKPRR